MTTYDKKDECFDLVPNPVRATATTLEPTAISTISASSKELENKNEAHPLLVDSQTEAPCKYFISKGSPSSTQLISSNAVKCVSRQSSADKICGSIGDSSALQTVVTVPSVVLCPQSSLLSEQTPLTSINSAAAAVLTTVTPGVMATKKLPKVRSRHRVENSNSNSSSSDESSENSDDSSSSNSGLSALMCRICHCEETSEEFLISPCYCTGTLRYVHQTCLQQWLKSNGMKSCELCKFDFIMQTKIRPFKNWEKLDMNNIERRKILCSVTFHLIAITCVIWSLYVLIQKTAEEFNSNKFDWTFWAKLVVVAIGFTGGVVFMYIQCKMYFQLCLRWRQYNRVIIIQPITEELLKNSRKKFGDKSDSFVCSKNVGATNSNNCIGGLASSKAAQSLSVGHIGKASAGDELAPSEHTNTTSTAALLTTAAAAAAAVTTNNDDTIIYLESDPLSSRQLSTNHTLANS